MVLWCGYGWPPAESRIGNLTDIRVRRVAAAVKVVDKGVGRGEDFFSVESPTAVFNYF